MKKRLISVLIAVVFLMVMFAACSDEPQEVKVVGQSMSNPTVNSVTVVKSNDNKSVILTWDAVENGTAYTVYWQREGKKTVERIGSEVYDYSDSPLKFIGWWKTYNAALVSSDNTDQDKWTAVYTFNTATPSAKYRFGISASVVGAGSLNTTSIKWSEYIQIN
jgi:hypothetical protein